MSTRRGLSFAGMTVGLLFVVVGLRALLIGAEPDTYWALRAGRDIWRTHAVPRVDTYSFTAAGLPWPDHEWLWQAAIYPLFRLGGWPLVTLGAAAIVVSAVALTYRLTLGATSTRFLLMLLAIPLASLVWAMRPQIVTLLGLALLVTWLARERFARLPILFLVWANAHGGVVLGGVVLVAAFVTAAIRARATGGEDDRRRLKRLGGVLAACALATTLTPLGFGIFRFVAESEARLRAAHINEWRATLPGLSIDGVFWLLALAFVVLTARRWRTLRAGSWSDWVVFAAALALLPLAFRSLRHIGPFLLLAPAAASRLLGPDFRLRRASTMSSPDNPTVNAALLGIIGAGALAAVAVCWRAPLETLHWRPLPEGALAAVRACPGPLYNHYNEGGYLVWLTPETKVFVDNRQDPFPIDFLVEHLRVESGKLPPEPLFARWGIRCSFLGVDSPTVAALEKDGWRAAYRDDKWIVQVAPH
ncbi:MAG TPA: hypothetical protein VHJ20_17215 [Polyangia bacterium]|nr:hypothetical protein [Polyangia bacterium]